MRVRWEARILTYIVQDLHLCSRFICYRAIGHVKSSFFSQFNQGLGSWLEPRYRTAQPVAGRLAKRVAERAFEPFGHEGD